MPVLLTHDVTAYPGPFQREDRPMLAANGFLKEQMSKRWRSLQRRRGTHIHKRRVSVANRGDASDGIRFVSRRGPSPDELKDETDGEKKNDSNGKGPGKAPLSPSLTPTHTHGGLQQISPSASVVPTVTSASKLSPTSSEILLLNTIGTEEAAVTTTDSSVFIRPQSTESTSTLSLSPTKPDYHHKSKTSSSILAPLQTHQPSTTLATTWTSTSATPSPQITGQLSGVDGLGPATSSSSRNSAIVGGTVGAFAAVVGVILFFIFYKHRCSKPPMTFNCLKRRRHELSPKASVRSLDNPMTNPISAPLYPPALLGTGWNYEESFATPSNPTPPTPRTRRFRGPLALNPPTPPPASTNFPAPRSLARTFFRSSNGSSHSLPSLTQNQRTSAHTRSSLAMPHRYDRLPSMSGSVGESDEYRAMTYFSRTSNETEMPKSPPSVLQRESQATMRSAESETPRFRSVPSWVNHQSQRQMKENKQEVILKGKPVSEVTRKPVSRYAGAGVGGDGSEDTNAGFEEHPGTKVDVPGLKGKRIRSTVLDRNIWGWGMRRSDSL